MTTDEGARDPAQRPSREHEVVIVGGGAAGVTVAARLRRAGFDDVCLIEPSAVHHYQPLWTLVGAGVVAKQASERAEAGLIPPGTIWIQDAVTSFLPEDDAVLTAGGERIGYAYLVVAPGLELDWDAVDGLAGHVGADGICSNYSYDTCDYTWELLDGFDGGTAIFTMPSGPVKCGGAAQKIAYLADSHFRSRGVRDRTKIIYATAAPRLFGVPAFTPALERVAQRKGIDVRVGHELIEVRADRREAVFRRPDGGEPVVLPYDMLHVTPPQRPPDVVSESPLAGEGGWVDVDKHTLRHRRYPNVFSLGDASSLPTGKTGAAVRKQAPVLVENLRAARSGRPLRGAYDGYASCPIPTDYGRLLLVEYDYDLKPKPSVPGLDPTKERWIWYQLKRYGLPAIYWHGMLKGRM